MNIFFSLSYNPFQDTGRHWYKNMICFSTNKNILEKAMSRFEDIIPVRNNQTLLSNVLLSVDEDKLNITASDMENTVCIGIPVSNVEKGELILNARKLNEISKQINAEEITLTVQTEEGEEKEEKHDDEAGKVYRVTLEGSGEHSARYKMNGSHKSQFPGLNRIPDENLFTIPSDILSEMILKTEYSISQEDNRYIYNGICFKANEDQLSLIGTDGRRLAAISRKVGTNIKFAQDETEDIVVHKKAINGLKRILDMDTEVQLGVEQRDIFFKVGDSELSSRLLEGKFPDYKKVIPEDTEMQFDLDKESLLGALRQVMVMTEKPSFQIKMLIQRGELSFSSNTPDVGQADIKLPLNYEGDSMQICFNASYLMDILRCIKSPNLQIKIKNENKPIITYEPEDKDFIALIMPMKA